MYHVACGIIIVIPGIEAGPSVVKEWSPNHRTTRELLLNIAFTRTEIPEKNYVTHFIAVFMQWSGTKPTVSSKYACYLFLKICV